MYRKDGITQKGNSISAKDRSGRTTTETTTELSSSPKVARPSPPATSASARARGWQYALEQLASKSTSNQTRGRSFGDKETKKVSSSSEANVNISGYDDQSIARILVVTQAGQRSKASRQSEQCQDSKTPLFQTAAVNTRVKLSQPDRKSNGAPVKSAVAVAGTPEKKAVHNSWGSRDAVANDGAGKELCKYCKSSMLESVCFISNDGRIAAIRTGASVRHLHVCDSPRCAANPNYNPSLAVPNKFLVSQRRLFLPQFAKDKSSAPSSVGIRSVVSSSNSSLHGDGSPRYSVAVPFQNTRKAKNGAQESRHSGGGSAVDQDISGEDERGHNAGAESHCGSSIANQNGSNRCGLISHKDDPSSTFVRESEDEQSGNVNDRESGRECCTLVAYDNSTSFNGSQDQKSSRLHEAGVLESADCIPIVQENGASPDYENEQSRGGSSDRFGSEGAVMADHEISTSTDGSIDQKTCSYEAGELEISGCSTPVAPEQGGSSSFMRDFEEEQNCGSASNRSFGSDFNKPILAHENSASIDESQDQKTCNDETGKLDSGCSTPVGQDKRPSSSFIIRDFEDERSCRSSNTEFGSGCSTPILTHENFAPIASSQDNQKNCRDEEGDLDYSSRLGYDNGQSGTCESCYHHGDDELSCTDDDREGTMTDDTNSARTKSLGRQDNSFDQSSNKLEMKRSSVSRMRRNYLNMLKEQEEAETVRLRRQEIQKRKQPGDWMIDCAIEEVLHKLAPNGETPVKVLVEAYETVIPNHTQ